MCTTHTGQSWKVLGPSAMTEMLRRAQVACGLRKEADAAESYPGALSSCCAAGTPRFCWVWQHHGGGCDARSWCSLEQWTSFGGYLASVETLKSETLHLCTKQPLEMVSCAPGCGIPQTTPFGVFPLASPVLALCFSLLLVYCSSLPYPVFFSSLQLLNRKDKTTFEKLDYLMSKEDNYKRTREYIRSLKMVPSIPYLGRSLNWLIIF